MAAVWLSSASLFHACSVPGRQVAGEDEAVLGAEQFGDLPIPNGFRLLAGVNQSWSWRSGKFRMARFQYEGDATLDALEAYLEDRLPMHGWELLHEERSARKKLEQQWISRHLPGVHYMLSASYIGKGPRTRLTYLLRTKRVIELAEAGMGGADKQQP